MVGGVSLKDPSLPPLLLAEQEAQRRQGRVLVPYWSPQLMSVSS